jgi:hypothetical protein
MKTKIQAGDDEQANEKQAGKALNNLLDLLRLGSWPNLDSTG